MLQGVRESFQKKWVFAAVVVAMLIMVLGGVGTVNLGSVVGNDAASVGSGSVSETELARAISMRRNQLISNGVDPTSDFVQPENLRQPVLQQLVRREALLSNARDGGMGAADELINQTIVSQEVFQVDGEFDAQTYRRLLANVGYTPASYKQSVSEDLILDQQTQGLVSSGFITEAETDMLLRLLNEERSFFALTIPADAVDSDISIAQEAIEQYYQENSEEFVVPEKASVNYLVLSVADIASGIEVAEEDVRASYQQFVDDFATEAEYQVAHILIEEGDDASDRVAEVQAQLNAGEDFGTVAEVYSDDFGSRDQGGDLGVLIPGTFPEAFDDAVFAMAEGEVSGPVETEAGTHFIKVVSKSETKVPTFEEKADQLRERIQRVQAESIYVDRLEEMKDIAFNPTSLDPVSEAMGLPVQTTELFTRNRGQGIASESKVRDAAFSAQVLVDGRNSPVLELGNDRAVVLNLAEHEPEHIAPLEQVQERIRTTLVEQEKQNRLAALAEEVQAEIESGRSAAEVAEERELALVEHEAVTRSDAEVKPELLRAVFAMPRLPEGQAVSFSNTQASQGGRLLVGLVGVTAGDPSEVPAQERKALQAQLLRENGNQEISSFEQSVVADTDVSY